MSDTLRPEDEPQDSGAVVAVNWGDYRTLEIWQRGGASDSWVCLGNEFGRPKPWDDPRTEMQKHMWHPKDGPIPRPGYGEVKRWARWSDVLERGPVTLLVPGNRAMYEAGWAAGRRHLAGQVEELAEDGPEDDALCCCESGLLCPACNSGRHSKCPDWSGEREDGGA